MTKSFEYANYVLANYSAITKCLKDKIKDKNILEFITNNLKKQSNSKYYIESNCLYILNDENISFGIKILPSIEKPNNIEITKKITDTYIQTIKIDTYDNIIVVSNDIKRRGKNYFNNYFEYSCFLNDSLIFKSKQEENTDYIKQSKECNHVNIIIDGYGNYISRKGIKVESTNILYENNNYYKGKLNQTITYNNQKKINTNIDNLIKYSNESSEEEYTVIEEQLENIINNQTIKRKIK